MSFGDPRRCDPDVDHGINGWSRVAAALQSVTHARRDCMDDNGWNVAKSTVSNHLRRVMSVIGDRAVSEGIPSGGDRERGNSREFTDPVEHLSQ
jgi:hypothetical protein